MQHTFADAREMIHDNEISAVEEFRAMPNDVLLALWEQLQNMEIELRMRFGNHVTFAPNYEKIILEELSLRSYNDEVFVSDIPFTPRTLKKPRIKRTCPHPIGRR